MDPDRLFTMPRRDPSRSQPPMMSSSTPEPQTRPIAPSTTQCQQPSLPSIRQLHPYLSPSGALRRRLPGQESYSYPPPCAGPFRSTDPHPSQAIPSQSGIYPRSNAIDSDLEGDVEQQGPAKKKRRRQASWSCSECKRRKIKCDRVQGCGPCTRRGEQTKCQRRSLEPVDKYVTRAEYDELKYRTLQLQGQATNPPSVGVVFSSTSSVLAYPPLSSASRHQTTGQRGSSATHLETSSLRAWHVILTSVARATFLSSESLLTDHHTQLLDSVPYENLTGRIRKQNTIPTACGGYGDIHKCFLDTGTENIDVAVKSLRPFTTPDGEGSCDESKMLCRELAIWARLHHENVLPFYGIAFGFGPLPAIVGPWAENGTLGDYLGRNPGLPTRVRLLCEIASGLHYLHSKMVIHGDLTGTNVLIDGSGKACLSDFGLATIHHEFLGTSFYMSSSLGNIRWAAPELFQVLEGEGNQSVLCSEETDVYSYGSIILQVLSGKVPFSGSITRHVYGKVALGHRPPRETGWNGQPIPDVYWHFIERCWDKAPSKRPSSSDVLEFMRSQLTEPE